MAETNLLNDLKVAANNLGRHVRVADKSPSQQKHSVLFNNRASTVHGQLYVILGYAEGGTKQYVRLALMEITSAIAANNLLKHQGEQKRAPKLLALRTKYVRNAGKYIGSAVREERKSRGKSMESAKTAKDKSLVIKAAMKRGVPVKARPVFSKKDILVLIKRLVVWRKFFEQHKDRKIPFQKGKAVSQLNQLGIDANRMGSFIREDGNPRAAKHLRNARLFMKTFRETEDPHHLGQVMKQLRAAAQSYKGQPNGK